MASTNQQKCDFEQRRLAVMRKHLASDPKLKLIRRKRKRAVLASVVGSFVVMGVVMVLIKAFVIALEGPQAYTRMIAPVLQGQAEGSVIEMVLRPDPVSTELAAVLAPILPRQTPPSQAPLAVSLGQSTPLPEADDQP